MAESTCPAEDYGYVCGRPIAYGGRCTMHYQRERHKHRPRQRLPFPDSIYHRITKLPNGCVIWTGVPDLAHYAGVRGEGKLKRAHQWVWEHHIGPVPDGKVLDHTCHNEDPDCPAGLECMHRLCIRLDHLEPVTIGENVLRGNGPAAQQARQTHCKWGHELPPYVGDGKKRECRMCWTATNAWIRWREHGR